MKKSMPSARPLVRHLPSLVDGAGAAPPALPVNFDIEMARRMFGSLLEASQDLLRLASELQQLNTRALSNMSTRLTEAMAQASRARDMQELLGVQTALVSSQMAIATQAAASWAARCMNAEALLVEQSQEDAARLSRQLLGDADGSEAATVSSPRAVADETPLGWLGNAQSAWTDMTGRWVEMAKMTAAGESLPQF